MVGHDLYLLQCPPVCGAGFGYDVATCYFDFSDENLVPVFGTEDNVVAKFIDLVAISLHVHKTYGSLVSWCNNNRSINRTRMQKDNYARLRAEYPELPSQFVCIAMRDRAIQNLG